MRIKFNINNQPWFIHSINWLITDRYRDTATWQINQMIRKVWNNNAKNMRPVSYHEESKTLYCGNKNINDKSNKSAKKVTRIASALIRMHLVLRRKEIRIPANCVDYSVSNERKGHRAQCVCSMLNVCQCATKCRHMVVRQVCVLFTLHMNKNRNQLFWRRRRQCVLYRFGM